MHRFLQIALCASFLLFAIARATADGPADNDPAKVRRIPKLGVEVPAEKRAELEAGLAKLRDSLDALALRKDARTAELLPDIEIFHKAAHDALTYQEFFQPKEIDSALELIAQGQRRADELAAAKTPGQSPWASASGLVVRGYVSKIDGSVQPYGLVVPASYTDKGPARFRLDVWFHGRGETLSEVNFLTDRSRNVGPISPADTIVLHPYGRYSNAFKFAGETDVLEAIESVKRRYRVDEDRIAVRGFSMGGAAAWHFAVHYPDRWFAANPGAGFSETPEFLRVFQGEELRPTEFERRLWNLYDCNRWASNLRYCPTVAYSGELDSQKQAADVIERALLEEDVQLTHVIGPKTAHSIHPQSRDEIERRMASLARRGRQHVPAHVRLVTYTLKYNRMHWLTVDGLDQHWVKATAEGRIDLAGNSILLNVENVRGLTLDFAAGECPLDFDRVANVVTPSGQKHRIILASDRSLRVSFHRIGDAWHRGRRDDDLLRKRHDLQGPIDDAFMDSFIFVRPSGKSWNAEAGKWAAAELDRAVEHWRRHFRGTARVKADRAITDQDIADANLVLWGDPSSNQVLDRIAEKLPIRWTEKAITVPGTIVGGRDREFDARSHALVAIYPNPLNPRRYVVLNSGFTFREYAYLNNARQVPMLPDWAIVDLTTPPGTVWPGKIAAADFFGEDWQVMPAREGE
jgi:pimeloyl-ACP methyl ester carboxylesterase